MKNKSEIEINWLELPEEHDYPAAGDYLSLFYDTHEVLIIVNRLKSAEMSSFKAKDIFRASQLPLLGVSNSHVEKNTKKINAGKSLSPLLLVRDKTTMKLIIADGYHRMCSIYGIDEDAVIPCKIV